LTGREAGHDHARVEEARRLRASRVLLGLMVPSGFAGLGYQIVWTTQSATWLGHEAASVLAVVGAFFGGLALGALALGARIEASPHPRRVYAACELVLGGWGALLLAGLPTWSGWLMSAMGPQPPPWRQWAVGFGGTLLALLPATAAMGATLPAMERLASMGATDRPERPAGGAPGRSVAALYAANTLGAVLGVLATAFCLIPRWGLARSGLVCVALNVMCAALALALLPRRAAAASVTTGGARGDPDPAAGALPLSLPNRRARRLQAQLAATGFLGIGYEVVVVRVLSQVSEDTVYTFALLLAVYLVGTAIGAAAYHRRGKGPRARHGPGSPAPADGFTDRLLAALAVACLGGAASLWGAEAIKALATRLLGSGMAAALAAEMAPALLAFGPPTVVMGAVFSHLSRQARAAGVTFGRSLGVNTLAAAAAPVVFGVVALPSLGAKLALGAIVIGYILTAGPRAWRRPRATSGGPGAARRATTAALAAAAVITVAAAWTAPPLAFVEVPDGGRVVSYREGVLGAVSVVADAEGVTRLRIDNRQQEGSSATWRVDARQAWLPLLLHPGPRRALFLGLGTGVTAASAADDPAMEVDAVELLPEVIAASAHFRAPETESGPSAPVPGPARLHVIAGDARRFVRATRRRYDVIVADNFHPARSGSGALYTVEHFEAVRARLEAGGLFCQWLPLHQLDLPTVRSIVRSFVTVNRQAWAVLASNSLETPVLGLLARAQAGGSDGRDQGESWRDDEARFDEIEIRARLASLARSALPERATRLGFEDELAVLGSAVAGPAALRRFADGAPANTDDHPVVTYRAPRLTYAPASSPRDRLLELVTELGVAVPEEWLASPQRDRAFAARLAVYWTARNQFLSSGRGVRPTARVEEMLAQVREPLLGVLRLSPDFRPAYDPLLAMAATLARTDASGARVLLAELTRLQPARVEAPRLLAALDGATSQGAVSENRKQ